MFSTSPILSDQLNQRIARYENRIDLLEDRENKSEGDLQELVQKRAFLIEYLRERNNRMQLSLLSSSPQVALAQVATGGMKVFAQQAFKLDAATVVGTHLTIDDTGFIATKAGTSHCAVLGSNGFDSGENMWKVKVLTRHAFANEYWIMLGCHTTKGSVKPHPTGDFGVYGVSVCNNTNRWTTIKGSTTYGTGEVLHINSGDIITVSLDCTVGSITFTHANWNQRLEVPARTMMFPYFDPYDLNFELSFQ